MRRKCGPDEREHRAAIMKEMNGVPHDPAKTLVLVGHAAQVLCGSCDDVKDCPVNNNRYLKIVLKEPQQ